MPWRPAETKLKSVLELRSIVENVHRDGLAVVFTNGCFDLLHPGHVRCLEQCQQGGILIVAVNTDDSFETVKGRKPLVPFGDRCLMVAALECVDYVCLLAEPTPRELLQFFKPDVLAKGATSEYPIGHEIVTGYGGRVVVIPVYGEWSSSRLMQR